MPMCSAQCVSVELHLSYVKIKGSENEVDLLWYLTFNSRRSGTDRTCSFICKLHHTCLYLVSVHQMAPPQTEVADIKG